MPWASRLLSLLPPKILRPHPSTLGAASAQSPQQDSLCLRGAAPGGLVASPPRPTSSGLFSDAGTHRISATWHHAVSLLRRPLLLCLAEAWLIPSLLPAASL